MRARWTWLCWLAIGGCGSGAAGEIDGGADTGLVPVPVHCPGERPPLEDCFTGRNFAECGGTGDDLYGCDGYACRWFVAGCVPEGYLISNCPPDDICCHGDFPYAIPEEISYDQARGPWHAMYGNGRLPWHRTDRMLVTVTVDSAHVPAPTDLACENGFTNGESPCLWQRVRATAGDLLILQIGEIGLWGNYVTIEIDGDTARACTFPYTDAIEWTCPAWDEVDCAEGSVLVNQLDDPGTIAGTVDLSFASGAHIGGTFTVE